MPAVGDGVILRDADDQEYRSRIEGVLDGILLVARPTTLIAAVVYDRGAEFDLVWTKDSGIHAVPVELANTSTDGSIRLWHMAVTGDARTEQRRDYVRVPVGGTISIDVDSGRAGGDRVGEQIVAYDEPTGHVGGAVSEVVSLSGTLVDLSEVALQAAVSVEPGTEPLRQGQAARCRFTVGGVEYSLAGRVIIVRPGDATRERRIVVRFEESRATENSLRKEVFALQLAARRRNTSQ